MPQIMKAFSLYTSQNRINTQRRRKDSVSSPALSRCNENLQPSGCHRVFYNVIQDYLPDEDRKWTFKDDIRPLKVEKGDIVQLLRKYENNTVLVKKLNSLEQGFVPLRFLSIDAELTKLSNTSSPLQSSPCQFEIDNDIQSGISSSPSTIFAPIHDDRNIRNISSGNNRSISIDDSTSMTKLHLQDIDRFLENSSLIKSIRLVSSNVSTKRVWYRIDITTSSGHKRYLQRHYNDFYQLHTSLLSEFMKHSLRQQDLPNLPKPVVNTIDQEYISERLVKLTKYLEAIIFSDIIPKPLKNVIVLERFCCAKAGDLCQTPRGSFYILKECKNCTLSWEKVSLMKTDGLQDSITCYLQQSSSSKSESSIQVLNSHSSNYSSIYSSPPNSPQTSAKMGFPSDMNNKIKVKIFFAGDYYAIKCHLTEIDTWEKFVSIIHAKLIRDVPDPYCPITISYQSSQDENPITIEGSAYDIEKILYQQNMQEPTSRVKEKCINTDFKQCSKLQFTVAI